jgi:NAD-dependent SIR2 family protein deacetylase
LSDPLDQAARAIASADALVIGAGAGFGVDSGLPDFRGDRGFWKAYPPLKELGISFVEMANPRWFQSDPELAWGFYGHRLNLYRETEPHDGFSILRRWGEEMERGMFVYTSNVDGQFQAAGYPEKVVECHGSIRHLQCTAHCSNMIWSADDVEVIVDERTFRAEGELPSCPACGALARPNILMFNDWGWISDRTQAQEESYSAWLQTIRGANLVVVECGAGSAVPTVRYQCQQLGGTLIRINPREPEGPAGTISIPMGALEALSSVSSRTG